MCLVAQSLVADVDKFSEVAGDVKRGFTGIGENETSILIRSTLVGMFLIPFVNLLHLLVERVVLYIGRSDELETILGAVSLTTLSETAMSVTD